MSLFSRTALSSQLPNLALLATLLLLTWTLAHWTWVFLTPRLQEQVTKPVAPELNKVLAEQAVTYHLFGGVAPSTQMNEGAPAAAPSNITLRGVYATEDGRSGFAALVLDGLPVSALVGKEFAPGMLLQRAYADRVEIHRNGQVETVRLLPPTSAVQVSVAEAKAATPALRIQVRDLGGNQFGVSRANFLESLKRADQLALLGRFGPYPRGGAVLEKSPAGGLPEQLGLKVGDVVNAINGKLLAGPGDVMRLYEQLVQSDKVNVDVLRAGNKMNFVIQVAP
jgi:type II secretory pathway component PulC